MPRRLLGSGLLAGAILLGLLLPGRAAAAVAFAPCGSSGVECAEVDVPLDRSGVVPGTISLHVERLQADGFQRGVMLLLAGGPGQAAAGVFDLGTNAPLFRVLFPFYTLVTFDVRGTGRSGLLDCPALQAAVFASVQKAAQLAADCANAIGPSRAFYATRDHAEDIEAVRQALGVDQIAIWGTSYGTKLALAYALAHPDHVERLLLDSVVAPDGPSPYGLDVLGQLTNGLSSICAGNLCRGVTRNFPGEVVTLANRLAATPLSGRVLVAGAGSVAERLNGLDFLSVVVDSHHKPGIAAELPAAVHAALGGTPQALLRLFALDSRASLVPASDLSVALYAATTCDDGHFAWDPQSAVTDRQAPLDAALAALAPGATGPFGPWATDFGTSAFCRLWPAPDGGAQLGPGPLPDVPVLILSGDRDMRTPTAGAQAVAAQFPHAHVLVVPGVGHSVLTADLSGCAPHAVRNWMNGIDPPSRCKTVPPVVAPLDAFPVSAALVPVSGGVAGLPGRTLTTVARTLREASATWTFDAFGFSTPRGLAGLYGGRLVPALSEPSFTLSRYSDVPGVEVSGTLRLDTNDPLIPLRFVGSVKVAGSAAAGGSLRVQAHRLSGTLGGRSVAVRR